MFPLIPMMLTRLDDVVTFLILYVLGIMGGVLFYVLLDSMFTKAEEVDDDQSDDDSDWEENDEEDSRTFETNTRASKLLFIKRCWEIFGDSDKTAWDFMEPYYISLNDFEFSMCYNMAYAHYQTLLNDGRVSERDAKYIAGQSN